MNIKRKIENLLATLPAPKCTSENIAKLTGLPVKVVAAYMLAILMK